MELLLRLIRLRPAPILAVAAAISIFLVFAPGCGLDARPTDTTGTGRTEALEEALSLHDLQLPPDASNIAYTVHTSIDSHAVGIRLRTTPAGLDHLLASLGSRQRDLRTATNPWEQSSRLSPRSPQRYGWSLESITAYAGLEVQSSSSLGSTGVLVNLGVRGAPVVYVEALDCC